MACSDMSKVINDTPIYVRQWPASIAIENLSRAIAVLGGAFGPFVDGTAKFSDVMVLLRESDTEVITPLLKTFICSARIDGKEVTPTTFNSVYNGELNFLFDVFGFVCEVQYKSFFEQGLKTPDPLN